MTNAEIISIGTEILLGEITDTNTRTIARGLRDYGIDVYRTSTVGDNPRRIAVLIRESIQRADIVITSGGLGPTVDDPTRAALAEAFGVDLEFKPALWEMILERFRNYGSEPTPNNKQQAYLPAGAQALPNPRGTAPGILFKHDRGHLFSLPGVPSEMEFMLENQVLPRLDQLVDQREIILTRIIQTRDVGESRIDDLIQDLEKRENPTVGLAARKGGVQIRLAAKARDFVTAEQLLDELEKELNRRLRKWIVPRE